MAGGGESRFRFELTRLELAGVVVSTAASLFIVFLLGVYAGHGMGDRRLDDAERVVRLPVVPAAEETPGAEDLTFDDTLGDEDHPTRAARPGVAAGDHGAPAADVAGADDRGAASTGTRAGAAEYALGTHAAAPPPPGAPHVNARAADVPAGERPEAPRVPGPARTPEARVAVALAVPRTSASAPPAASLPPSQGGAWSVQVTATREPRTADDLLKRLRAHGYDAYIVRARREGAMFYRVRVGHFRTMEYASQMVSRLRREPGVPEAFVASD
jgi:cell division septation protein DedD